MKVSSYLNYCTETIKSSRPEGAIETGLKQFGESGDDTISIGRNRLAAVIVYSYSC